MFIHQNQHFVLIENIKNGRKYIGKKFFWKRIRRKPLKGKKRVRIDRVESDWKDYYGSSRELLEDIDKVGKQNIRRTILHCHKSKWACAYYELDEQMYHKVLFDEKYYNGIVNVRLKKNIKEKQWNGDW